MVDPTLTISIDRTSLSLTPLVFSGTLAGTTLGVVEYSPPAEQARIEYMPDNPHIHGSEPIGAALQQSILSFSWMRVGATAEAEIRASLTEVRAAIRRLEFTVTTTENGAAPEVWAGVFGSMALAENRRDRISLKHLVPVYAVTIPVYPIPGS